MTALRTPPAPRCAACGQPLEAHGPPHGWDVLRLPSCPPPSLTGTYRAPASSPSASPDEDRCPRCEHVECYANGCDFVDDRGNGCGCKGRRPDAITSGRASPDETPVIQGDSLEEPHPIGPLIAASPEGEPPRCTNCGHIGQDHGWLTGYCFHREPHEEMGCQCIRYVAPAPSPSSGGSEETDPFDTTAVRRKYPALERGARDYETVTISADDYGLLIEAVRDYEAMNEQRQQLVVENVGLRADAALGRALLDALATFAPGTPIRVWRSERDGKPYCEADPFILDAPPYRSALDTLAAALRTAQPDTTPEER